MYILTKTRICGGKARQTYSECFKSHLDAYEAMYRQYRAEATIKPRQVSKRESRVGDNFAVLCRKNGARNVDGSLMDVVYQWEITQGI